MKSLSRRLARRTLEVTGLGNSRRASPHGSQGGEEGDGSEAAGSRGDDEGLADHSGREAGDGAAADNAADGADGGGSGGGREHPFESECQVLIDMGFARNSALAALEQTNGDLAESASMLVSMPLARVGAGQATQNDIDELDAALNEALRISQEAEDERRKRDDQFVNMQNRELETALEVSKRHQAMQEEKFQIRQMNEDAQFERVLQESLRQSPGDGIRPSLLSDVGRLGVASASGLTQARRQAAQRQVQARHSTPHDHTGRAAALQQAFNTPSPSHASAPRDVMDRRMSAPRSDIQNTPPQARQRVRADLILQERSEKPETRANSSSQPLEEAVALDDLEGWSRGTCNTTLHGGSQAPPWHHHSSHHRGPSLTNPRGAGGLGSSGSVSLRTAAASALLSR